MPNDTQPTYHVKEKNLLDLDFVPIENEERDVIKEVVKIRPLKVDLELVGPPGINVQHMAKAVEQTIDKYFKLLAKQAEIAFKMIAEGYKDDQAGKKDGYSNAEAGLAKLNKYVNDVMNDFRVDLRETAAKLTKTKAKQFMTVGSVSVKELELVAGKFIGETAIEKKSEADSGELKSALKVKKWQHLGVAFSTKGARIALDKTKRFDASRLKELAELFPEGKRSGLKFCEGKFKAFSEMTFDVEFLTKNKSKLPSSSAEIAEQQMVKGVTKQIGKKPTSLQVKLVNAYSEKSAEPEEEQG